MITTILLSSIIFAAVLQPLPNHFSLTRFHSNDGDVDLSSITFAAVFRRDFPNPLELYALK